MVSAAEADSEDSSLNIRLLADMRDVFDDQGVDFLASAKVCELLRGIDESPWSQFDMNPSKLGHRLREYGIKTGHNPAKTMRGYRRADFLDAWERYTPGPKVSEPVQSRPQVADQHERWDTFGTPDTFKASVDSKASHDNPSSEGVRTPSDAFGRDAHGGRFCEQCGGEIYRDGATLCAACSPAGPTGWS